MLACKWIQGRMIRLLKRREGQREELVDVSRCMQGAVRGAGRGSGVFGRRAGEWAMYNLDCCLSNSLEYSVAQQHERGLLGGMSYVPMHWR